MLILSKTKTNSLRNYHKKPNPKTKVEYHLAYVHCVWISNDWLIPLHSELLVPQIDYNIYFNTCKLSKKISKTDCNLNPTNLFDIHSKITTITVYIKTYSL